MDKKLKDMNYKMAGKPALNHAFNIDIPEEVTHEISLSFDLSSPYLCRRAGGGGKKRTPACQGRGGTGGGKGRGKKHPHHRDTLFRQGEQDLHRGLGLVKSISLRAGDRIKKGRILARLNTDFIEKEIDLALTRIELVDVQIARKDKDIKRYSTLYKENAAAEKAYDDLVFGHSELFKEKDALLKQLEIARLKNQRASSGRPLTG